MTMTKNNGLVMMVDSRPYKVNVLFNNAATENIGDKIMRLVRRDVENSTIPHSKAAVEHDSVCNKSI